LVSIGNLLNPLIGCDWKEDSTQKVEKSWEMELELVEIEELRDISDSSENTGT
jgi:hypothetical protein